MKSVRAHTTPVRVGLGYDSHRFDPERTLVLGGVTVPGHPGLAGHSDADAVCHAVTDAVLGAAGVGDIGTLYPPSDDRWKNADSIHLLQGAVDRLTAGGYRVVNVDVAVVTESPRIAPLAQAMRARLSEALRVDPGAVMIKGKSNEGMGWIGAREGLAVHAVALVERVPAPPS